MKDYVMVTIIPDGGSSNKDKSEEINVYAKKGYTVDKMSSVFAAGYRIIDVLMVKDVEEKSAKEEKSTNEKKK